MTTTKAAMVPAIVRRMPRSSGRVPRTYRFTRATARICQWVTQNVQKWIPPGPEVTAGVAYPITESANPHRIGTWCRSRCGSPPHQSDHPPTIHARSHRWIGIDLWIVKYAGSRSRIDHATLVPHTNSAHPRRQRSSRGVPATRRPHRTIPHHAGIDTRSTRPCSQPKDSKVSGMEKI